MLKRFAILWLLSFAAAQAVSLTDCACGPLCGHKNACPGHETAPDDCCKDEPGQDCSHVEPQSDLLAVATAVDLPAEPLDVETPPAILPPAFEVLLEAELPPPARGRPLYLSLHALLI